MKRPSGPVATLRVKARDGFAMVTSAPATAAPVPSSTRPKMAPVEASFSSLGPAKCQGYSFSGQMLVRAASGSQRVIIPRPSR